MKLVTVKQKESKIVGRIPSKAAEKLVQDGSCCFVRKGVYKRLVKDNLKAKNRAKTKSIFGAKIIRKYEERKAKEQAKR